MLAALVVTAALGYACVTSTPAYSPPGRLLNRLHRGMSLGEVRTQAEDLGFAWRVDELRLERGHIICHWPGPEGYRCESFGDATSFGALSSSYACNVVVEEGKVKELWFYMD